MGRREKKLINKSLIEGGKTGNMFRSNSGKAFQGKSLKLQPHEYNQIKILLKKLSVQNTNILILQNPRMVELLPAGFPDTFGWEEKKIAPECCGTCKDNQWCDILYNQIYPHYKKMGLTWMYEQLQKCFCNSTGYEPFETREIAIFKGEESKTGKQQLTKDQKKWKRIIEDAGGMYNIRREDEEN